MKPIFLKKNTQTAEESFFSRYAEVPHTYDQYHYHNEYELIYNMKNNGTRFVGDSVEPFSNNDLVLVGPNIPHYWRSDLSFYNEPRKIAKVVCVHFLKDFAGREFFQLPEMKAASLLLDKAKHGIHFKGVEVFRIGANMLKLTRTSGWERLQWLITILCQLAEIREYDLLASAGFCESITRGKKEEKISEIYNYLIKNHQKDIKLQEVSCYAGMNPSAFCRYFKMATNKTLSEVINEIRIGIACRNIINTDMPISNIAYECGYQNVPYFNRQFRKMQECSPMEYRLQHQS